MRDERTDEELGIALGRDHDPTAYVELCRRYEARSFWFAPHGCPDLVETILWRWLHNGASTYNGARRFDRFLLGALKNEWKKARKKAVRFVRLEELGEGQEPMDPRHQSEDLLRAETRQTVEAAIAQLPQPERTAQTELVLNGLSYRVVATRLKWSHEKLQRVAKNGRALLAVMVAKRLGLEPSKSMTGPSRRDRHPPRATTSADKSSREARERRNETG
jgi:DNA-directed RNA polymerase specialized sigma24 family protein